jgi:hypothetical protein
MRAPNVKRRKKSAKVVPIEAEDSETQTQQREVVATSTSALHTPQSPPRTSTPRSSPLFV